VLNTVLGGVSIIIGLQLGIFGLSTHIYAAAHKHVKANFLVKFSRHPYTLKAVMYIGISLVLIGLIAIVGGAFSGETPTLGTVERIGSVTGAWLLVMLGVQMTYASFFLASLSMGGNARDARSPNSVSQAVKETHAERPYRS
jgi:hypothetical protein